MSGYYSKEDTVVVTGANPPDAAKWVQVISKYPSEQNLLADETGELAELGNFDGKLYLAGTLGGEATREFHIDEGTPLIAPLLNYWEEEWFVEPDNLKEAARDVFESLDITDLFLRIDLNNDGTYEFDFDLDEKTPPGQVNKFYVESNGNVTITIPDDNIYNNPEADPPIDLDAGDYEVYMVGYFAEIKPLMQGTHKIEFGGSAIVPLGDGDTFEFTTSTTDIITVGEPLDDYMT
jgi:hypothetical protein